jgi:hypothetical protein
MQPEESRLGIVFDRDLLLFQCVGGSIRQFLALEVRQLAPKPLTEC